MRARGQRHDSGRCVQVKALASNRNSLMMGIVAVTHEVVDIRYCLQGEHEAIHAQLVSVFRSLAQASGGKRLLRTSWECVPREIRRLVAQLFEQKAGRFGGIFDKLILGATAERNVERCRSR